jgi:hypothetical protein
VGVQGRATANIGGLTAGYYGTTTATVAGVVVGVPAVAGGVRGVVNYARADWSQMGWDEHVIFWGSVPVAVWAGGGKGGRQAFESGYEAGETAAMIRVMQRDVAKNLALHDRMNPIPDAIPIPEDIPAPRPAGVTPRSLNVNGSMDPVVFEGTIDGMRAQLRNPQTAEAFWRSTVARDGPITIYEINGQRYIFNGNHRFQAALAEGAEIPEWAIRVEQRPNYTGPLFRLDQMDRLPGTK